jgi:hypothetical protein
LHKHTSLLYKTIFQHHSYHLGTHIFRYIDRNTTFFISLHHTHHTYPHQCNWPLFSQTTQFLSFPLTHFLSSICNPLIILPPSPLLEPNSNSTFSPSPTRPPHPCAQTSLTPNLSLVHEPVIPPPLCQVLQYSYHPPPLHTSNPAFTKPTRYLLFLTHFPNMSILSSSHYTPSSAFEKIHHSFKPSTNPEIPQIPPSDNDYAILPSTNQSKPGHLIHGPTTFKLYTSPFCYKPSMLISSPQFPIASLPAPYIHPAHYSHFQHMISILFLTHTP